MVVADSVGEVVTEVVWLVVPVVVWLVVWLLVADVVVVSDVVAVEVNVEVALVVGVLILQSLKVPSKYEPIIVFSKSTVSAQLPVSFKKPPTVHRTSLANGPAGDEYARMEDRSPLCTPGQSVCCVAKITRLSPVPSVGHDMSYTSPLQCLMTVASMSA